MKEFTTILCPIDFSEFSQRALRYAVSFAHDYLAQLVVCNAVPEFIREIDDRMPISKQALLADSEGQINSFLFNKVPPDIPLLTRTAIADPSEFILRTAVETSADLIVMGTHGNSGVERLITGSVTYKVLNQSTIPVLTVCRPTHQFIPPDSQTPMEIHRILCAVDLEGAKERMITLASSLAATYKSEIRFLHVRQLGESEERIDEEMHRLEKLVKDRSGVPTSVQLQTGHPVQQIVHTATANQTDLLFLGHHSRLPSELGLMGSVAGRVITESPCPAMVVRE